MTLEDHVADVVGELRAHRDAAITSWSLERVGRREDVAAGVASALLHSGLAEGIDGIRQATIGTSLLLGAELSAVASGIAQSNTRLDHILDALRHPLGTASRERYDRGSKAFRNGWLDDAETDLRAAVDAEVGDPYFAEAHLLLGMTLVRVDRQEEAQLALRNAVKYGTPDHPRVAVTAALLAGRAFLAAGENSNAAALLRDAIDAHHRAPELHLMLAEAESDPSPILEALTLAPSIADVAALKLPELFELAASSADPRNRAVRTNAAALHEVFKKAVEVFGTEDDEHGLAKIDGVDRPDGSGLLAACRLLAGAQATRDALHEAHRLAQPGLGTTSAHSPAAHDPTRSVRELEEIKRLIDQGASTLRLAAAAHQALAITPPPAVRARVDRWFEQPGDKRAPADYWKRPAHWIERAERQLDDHLRFSEQRQETYAKARELRRFSNKVKGRLRGPGHELAIARSNASLRAIRDKFVKGGYQCASSDVDEVERTDRAILNDLKRTVENVKEDKEALEAWWHWIDEVVAPLFAVSQAQMNPRLQRRGQDPATTASDEDELPDLRLDLPVSAAGLRRGGRTFWAGVRPADIEAQFAAASTAIEEYMTRIIDALWSLLPERGRGSSARESAGVVQYADQALAQLAGMIDQQIAESRRKHEELVSQLDAAMQSVETELVRVGVPAVADHSRNDLILAVN